MRLPAKSLETTTCLNKIVNQLTSLHIGSHLIKWVVMKSSIHPQTYRPVVFSDDVAGFAFLTQSTAQTSDTIKWEDGNEYPLVKVHISSKSHPFFTGEEKIIDTEGRVDRFAARLKAAEERKAALAAKAKKANAKKATKADK